MKKLATTLIVTAAMLANTLAVAAAELPTLTVDRAVHRAMGNSERIIQLAEDIILEEIRGREISQRLIGEFREESILLGIAIDRMTHEIAMAFQHSDRSIQIDMITQSIQRIFLEIIKAETDLKFLDREIAIERQNFRFHQIRHEYGLMSNNDFNEARQSIQNLELQRENLEASIDRAHRSLVNIVGGSRRTRYAVQLELEFAPLCHGRTADDFVAIAFAQNAELRRARRNLDVTQYEFNVRGSRSDDDRTAREIQLNRAQRNVQTLRNDLENSIINLYEDIRQMERALAGRRASYTAMQAELAVNEAMLEMERITQIEFDTFLLRMDRLRHGIHTDKADHTMMVQRLRNPNLQ